MDLWIGSYIHGSEYSRRRCPTVGPPRGPCKRLPTHDKRVGTKVDSVKSEKREHDGSLSFVFIYSPLSITPITGILR